MVEVVVLVVLLLLLSGLVLVVGLVLVGVVCGTAVVLRPVCGNWTPPGGRRELVARVGAVVEAGACSTCGGSIARFSTSEAAELVAGGG